MVEAEVLECAQDRGERETLVDRLGRPLRDLRLSVTDRCNFRCRYCMPSEKVGSGFPWLKRDEQLSFDEMVRLVRLFSLAGVVKVRITGGEPLVRPRLPELVCRIREVPGIEDIAMTTNGVLLPVHAHALKQAGLNRVTISLDALDVSVFKAISGGVFHPEQVLEGIQSAIEAGFSHIKVNVVVQRGVNEGEVLPILEKFRGTGVTVRFIEYMDVGNVNEWNLNQVVPSAELMETIHAVYPIIPMGRRYPGEVAGRYRFADGQGEIGFVSSITQPFCKPCNRARLSADGKLFTCLFAVSGTDFRALLRNNLSDNELFEHIRATWGERTDQYSQLRRANAVRSPDEKVEMFYIGG